MHEPIGDGPNDQFYQYKTVFLGPIGCRRVLQLLLERMQAEKVRIREIRPDYDDPPEYNE